MVKQNNLKNIDIIFECFLNWNIIYVAESSGSSDEIHDAELNEAGE